MRRLTGVLLVLLSTMALPDSAAAQPGGTAGGVGEVPDSGFLLGSNYPNPFNAETRIPFDLFEDLFSDGRPVVVSIRIYDQLRQYVGTPSALNHPAGEGAPLIDLEYTTPGRHEAIWDGRDGRDGSGARVASGVYILELTVNGRSDIRLIFARDSGG